MKNFFIGRPIFAISLSVIIVLLGAISIGNLAIEQYPDITPPVVEVTATYEGADAETVNNAVATPIAESIMGVSDMLYMQATSANDGSMTLQVTFDIGSDADLDAIFTQNNVATAMAKLPASVTEQGVVTRKTQTGFLMVYALYSDGRYDENFLSNYAYINIQNELLKINGIGKVEIMGAGEYAMRVWLRPDLLAYYNISVSDILSAISTEAGIYPAGKFGAEPTPSTTQFTYTVTMPRQISSAEEFGDILLRTTERGTQLRLRDVATIELGNQNYGANSRFGDMPTTIISIYQEPNSNAVALGKAVKAKMSELAKRMPDGVEFEVLVDGTKSISAGIREIFETLIIALVLVILIIFIFLQDWRATLIPLVAIPVSIIGTFMVFPLLGFTINIISLLGLVLSVGLVVDDAIVVVEAVQANIERGLNARKATDEAMGKVTSPIIATTIVLLAVFIPISFSGGISARLFQQFAITISVSVVFSTINALSLSPALCGLLLRPHKERTTGFFGAFNRLFDRAMGRYSEVIGKVVSRWRTSIVVVAVMAVAIVAMLKILPKGFLPEEDLGFFTISVNAPDNTALSRTEQIMAKVDSVTKATLPIVESTGVVSGFNMISGVAATNSGVVFVKLKDFDQRKMSAMEAVAELNRVLYSAIPEAECGAFVSPSIPGLGVTSGVTFELQDRAGKGTEYLAEQSNRLLAELRKEPRIKSASTEFRNGVAQKHLDIDKQHALMSGVSLSSLYSETATLLGGRMINNFNLYGRLYQSYLQAAPEYRENEASLNGYYLKNGNGESVPLTSFVSVRDTTGVQYISQFNLYRSIGINVSPEEGVSTGDVMDNIERIAETTLPDDVAIAWSGVSFQEREESGRGAWVFLIAFVFVFFTLSSLYESWSLPLSIVMSVPLAVVGALCAVGLAHLFAPQFINDIYMQISLAMLIGLASKNSILVVEYADKLFHEKQLSLLEATVNASKMRVRPILMTAFASILGILPLVFASGVYSTARNIIGVSLVGGLLFATIFGILLYPAFYFLVGKVARFEQKRQKEDNNA
ncbi:MAG: efflux RND transporter permease subunit [Alistipes sp.]|nr:efflux RND transporter permease subunit [Alistipes sp.]